MKKTFSLGVAFCLFLFAGMLAMGSGVVRGADQAPGGRTLGKATFAGGCFWCMEHPFDELIGVVSVTSGYTGGTKLNPTYEEVCSGRTGHTETVLVVFDPLKINYEELLRVFWEGHDPTQGMRQGNDSGTQYRSAIYTTTDG